MPGRFERMSGAERELAFPGKAKKSRGRPAAHPRKALNPPLFIPAAGCCRRGLPRGGRRESRSAGRRWLKTWHSDGRLKELQARLLGAARNEGLIFWRSGGAGTAHGYKGKGILIHLPADAAGKLLETAAVKTGKAGRPRRNVRRLAAQTKRI